MMNQKNSIILLLFSILLIILNVESSSLLSSTSSSTSTYKPILLMHGFALNNKCGTYNDWKHYLQYIEKYNPGQIAIALNVDNGLKSTKPMFKQINDIYLTIKNITENNEAFSNGFHIIAHSQGALLMRSIIEIYGLNVENFISLAGVHMGIYGVGFTNEYWFGNFTDKELTNLMYTSTMQKDFSVANWWTDPLNNERYLKDNLFLPIINQELPEKIQEYKDNFINSINGGLHAFGSPEDGVVVPWISELFGFYNDKLSMIDMTQMDVYKNDTFGLQTLSNQNKLNLTVVNGVEHAQWLSRLDLFQTYVLPLISK